MLLHQAMRMCACYAVHRKRKFSSIALLQWASIPIICISLSSFNVMKSRPKKPYTLPSYTWQKNVFGESGYNIFAETAITCIYCTKGLCATFGNWWCDYIWKGGACSSASGCIETVLCWLCVATLEDQLVLDEWATASSSWTPGWWDHLQAVTAGVRLFF